MEKSLCKVAYTLYSFVFQHMLRIYCFSVDLNLQQDILSHMQTHKIKSIESKKPALETTST